MNEKRPELTPRPSLHSSPPGELSVALLATLQFDEL